MSSLNIINEVEIKRTPRVQQIEGLFDISPLRKSVNQWSIQIELPSQWNIGVIVGPSGAGKTTIAKHLFDDRVIERWEWDNQKSIVDCFPDTMNIQDIVSILSSVGFSSPPSWLRPYRALSNGEQFRVHIARTLSELRDLAVVDEFTSVVDRTVAQIASAAIQKAVRRLNQKLVVVSCHYDILDWLEPDWVYQPHINQFNDGRSRRRPEIKLEIKRVHHSAWRIFQKHHYLDTSLNTSAVCFCAFWNDKPVAFTSWLHFLTGAKKHRKTKREHRTVCLPDYQGVGIGNALSDTICSMWKSLGYRAISTTSNPSMIQSRNRSQNWALTRRPSRTSGGGSGNFRRKRSKSRLTTSFEYIGKLMTLEDAQKLISKIES